MEYTGWVLENSEHKYLLQLRDNIPTIRYPGTWDLFGGAIEEGETPLEGALRELKEEIGLTLSPEDITLMFTGDILGGNHYIYHAFIPHKKEEITVYEGAGCEYFTIDQILALTNTREEMKGIFKGIPNGQTDKNVI